MARVCRSSHILGQGLASRQERSGARGHMTDDKGQAVSVKAGTRRHRTFARPRMNSRNVYGLLLKSLIVTMYEKDKEVAVLVTWSLC
jgi:hypothetical protein